MKIEIIKKNRIFVNKDYLNFLNDCSLDTFEDFMGLEGTVVKSMVKERSTQRLTLEGRTIYIKKHIFRGFGEILKNLFRFRLPIGALNEWRALLAFHAHGIPTMIPISAGRKSFLFGLEKESFLLTDDLGTASRLDVFLKEHFSNPCRGVRLEKKRRILSNLADLTQRMHRAGLNHRDYYLCHIFVDEQERLYVIDLHRVDIRKEVGRRWMVKDLAGLLFSSLDVPVTWGERLAFYKRYMQANRLTSHDKDMIHAILKKCNRIARHTKKTYADKKR